MKKYDYYFYCVACGYSYGYLDFLSKKKRKEPIECPKCGSHRFKKCFANAYGDPILPVRLQFKEKRA